MSGEGSENDMAAKAVSSLPKIDVVSWWNDLHSKMSQAAEEQIKNTDEEGRHLNALEGAIDPFGNAAHNAADGMGGIPGAARSVVDSLNELSKKLRGWSPPIPGITSRGLEDAIHQNIRVAMS